MGAIKTGSSKVLTDGKLTARVGDAVKVSSSEVSAAMGGKLRVPSLPKHTIFGAAPLPPSSGGAGGNYAPELNYDGELQAGVPGSAILDLDRTEDASYGSLQDFVNIFGRPGLIKGGTVSESSGVVSIEKGSGVLRIDTDPASALKFFDFVDTTAPVPNSSLFYIFLDLGGTALLRTSPAHNPDVEIILGSVQGSSVIFDPKYAGDYNRFTGDVKTTTNFFSSGIEVGFRRVPITDQDTNYQYIADDSGKARRKTLPGALTYTVSNTAHIIGDVLCAINFSVSDPITITGNNVILQLGGTLTTGNRTILPGGVGYIYMQSSGHAIVSGPGVT